MKPVCLVIGAGAGIGGTTGKRFAKEGYHAVLCRRSDEEGLQQLVADIETEGGSATGYLMNAVEPDVIEERIADIEANIAMALDVYDVDNGRYPTTDQGLKALLIKPESAPVPKNWKGPYLKKKRMPRDPWGNDYIYLSPGTHGDFDLISYGADATGGGDGKNEDINNWDLE